MLSEGKLHSDNLIHSSQINYHSLRVYTIIIEYAYFILFYFILFICLQCSGRYSFKMKKLT